MSQRDNTKKLIKTLEEQFHILGVDLFTQGPNLADIGIFVVRVLTRVSYKKRLKWESQTSSDKDDVPRLCYIYRTILKIIYVPQNA